MTQAVDERTLESTLLSPIMLAGVLALIMLVSSLGFAARRADTIAQHRDEQMTESRLRGWVTQVQAAQTSETQWDDAVANVDTAFDRAWVESNFTAWFKETTGLDRLLVLGADGQTLYAAQDGREVPADLLDDYARAAAPLVAKVRAAETARGPISGPTGRRVMTRPIQASRFIYADGAPRLMTASLVQPDFGRATPSLRAPILVGIMTLDETQFASITGDLMLRGARLEPGHRLHNARVNAAPVRWDGEPPVATVVWARRRPGTAILNEATPAIGLVALVMLLGGFWLVRRTKRLARGLVASQAHAQHVALHDSFTGLANRALLGDRLEQALERRRRYGGVVGVFCLDLDRFKEINDSLGHASGDEVIREVARRIATVCRATDTIARLGGDEFAVVQPDAQGPEDVQRLAERLQAALEGVVEVIAGQAVLSASIGVAIVARDGMDAAEALRQADLALYRAKERGRARFAVFDAEMDESARARASIADDLRLAIHSGALEVVYQPQVTCRGRQIVAVEALARWRHPTRGMVPPDQFIPIAEESDLIDELGLFVLRRACLDARRWPGVVTSVNVSAAQLKADSFVERCLEIVAETGIDPSLLELEITESVVLTHDARTVGTLRRLRDAGLRLALDDFGTGYSSLNHLKLYPVRKIKIDRSYVENLDTRPEDQAVVLAIIKLARAFDLTVTAEGVERCEQLNVLAQAGCNLIQGFLFSAAVAPARIEKTLRDHNRQAA